MMHDLTESKAKGLLPDDVNHPHGMRDEIKKLLHYAKKQSLEHIRHGPPGSTADRLSRALAAYRAWRSGSFKYLAELCGHFPELGAHFDADRGLMVSHTKFHTFLNTMAQAHYNKEQEDAIRNTQNDAKDRNRKLTIIQQLSLAWRACSRRISLTDVLPPEPSSAEPAPRRPGSHRGLSGPPDPLPVPSPPTREQMDALWPVEEMAS